MAISCPKITEQRVLHATVGGCIFGMLLMLISVCTDHWVTVNIPGAVYINRTNTYLLRYHTGLWKICRHELRNHTSQPRVELEYCTMLKFYPTDKEVGVNPEIDFTILNYSRAETAFAIISLILMGLGLAFSWYSLKEVRYMFKRLAAVLHLMTAVCIVVCNEVLAKSVNYEKKQLPKRLPGRATIRFGYSYGLAWVSFVFFLVAFVVFAWCSRKRKGHKARTEEEAMENEVVHLGRV